VDDEIVTSISLMSDVGTQGVLHKVSLSVSHCSLTNPENIRLAGTLSITPSAQTSQTFTLTLYTSQNYERTVDLTIPARAKSVDFGWGAGLSITPGSKYKCRLQRHGGTEDEQELFSTTFTPTSNCTLSANSDLTYNFTLPAATNNIKVQGNLIPAYYQNGTGYNLGTQDAGWDCIYATKAVVTNAELPQITATTTYNASAPIDSSDINKKFDIQPLTDAYSRLYDTFKPVSFKYTEGTSGRTHVGLEAQAVKASLDTLGIDTKDFAAYCEWEEEDGTQTCGIRYTELVSMNIYEIQKLKKKVQELEDELRTLKTQQND
jgi:hypothetical protein